MLYNLVGSKKMRAVIQMSMQDIEKYLGEVLRVVRQNWGYVPGRNLIDHLTRSGRLVFPAELASPLVQLLAAGGLHEGHLLTVGRSSGTIQVFAVANAMLERLALGASPKEICDDWAELLATRSGQLVSVLAIWGLTVDERVRLDEHVEIVPPKDVPASAQRDAVFGIDRWGKERSRIGFQIPQGRPRAALLIHSRYILVRSDEPSLEEVDELHERLAHIQPLALAAVTLSGDAAPVDGWSYDVANHKAISYSGLGFSGASGSYNMMPCRQGTIDSGLVQTVYDALMMLSPSVWSSLQLSIARLARSRGHANPVDRAIDLGIAIESTLLHNERGNGAKGELRYKIGTRGAWLLGKTPDDRRAVFRALRDAYDARSGAVHSGRLGKDDHALLPIADDLARRSLIKIALDGSYPDWGDLVLGTS